MRRLLSLFPLKPVRCPSCRLRIAGEYVWAHHRCIACAAGFKIRRRYFLTTYILALVVSGGLAFAVGNRGAALSSLASLLVVPTFLGMFIINLWLFPADIDIASAGWTPGNSDEDREVEREFEALRELDVVLGLADSETPLPEPAEPADPAERLPLSTPKNQPVTLEGIAIAIGLSALLAYHVYLALEPHL